MTMYEILCVKFVERAETLGYKGAKRDAAALNYMCGGATVLVQLGHAEAQHVAKACALLVATRGYAEVCLTAEKAKAKAMGPRDSSCVRKDDDGNSVPCGRWIFEGDKFRPY